MKAYTSLEQSKKLAEILPIESADMWYCPYPNDVDWYNEPRIGKAELLLNQLPCWSLAALIELLPYELNGHDLSVHKSYCPNDKGFAYDISYESLFDYGLSVLVSASSIEIIDACYEMILKLNEQKLL